MSRRALEVASILVFALLTSGAKTCGTDIGEKGLGEACTRDSDCLDELQCIAGECAASPDAGLVEDAGGGDGGVVDAG